jgi:hypothetical protein
MMLMYVGNNKTTIQAKMDYLQQKYSNYYELHLYMRILFEFKYSIWFLIRSRFGQV